MNITPELFDKLAALAKLDFDEAEKKEILNDLREITAFFEKLQEVNTDGVEPLIHINEGESRLRPDVAHSDISRDEALKNAPLHDGSHFKVPKVIKK